MLSMLQLYHQERDKTRKTRIKKIYKNLILLTFYLEHLVFVKLGLHHVNLHFTNVNRSFIFIR